jgi:DNA-binding transcriptional regulator YhcF (GntR family)
VIEIDPASSTPPYEQLRAQILAAINSGELAPGDRLPTVRKLAGDLGLAPNTAARAYRELEADAIIETRGRNGSYVKAQGDAARRQAQQAATAFAERTARLGFTPEEALMLARVALHL